MSELPGDVVVDILSRLPVKPLLRFRCISKSWCALIDSPYFIKLHLNQSIETNTNRNIIFGYCKLYSIDFDSLDYNAVEVNHPLKDDEGTELVGSCNGLLCLCNSENDVVLWNPSTRKHHKLPVTSSKFSLEHDTIKSTISYGFGYDFISDDYKVVRLIEHYEGFDVHSSQLKISSEVKVYSLKSNSWRRIKDFPYSLWIRGRNVVLVNGALHWVVFRIKESDRFNLIAGFDLGVEEYGLVPQPDYLDKDGEIFLETLGGCLCVIRNHYRKCVMARVVEIWVMKEYGVKESWTNLISVARPFEVEYLTPLAYSKSGEEVVLEEGGRSLIQFDLKMETIINIESLETGYPIRLGCHRAVKICFGSLVPLPLRGDAGSAEEMSGGEEEKEVEVLRRSASRREGEEEKENKGVE